MDTVGGVTSTFTSWDRCMQKGYCKWPVIIGIVIGSLILFSVLFCIFRCLCCGAKCACCCADCCSVCCATGSKKSHRRIDSNPYRSAPPPHSQPPTNQQYRSEPAPQFARFETKHESGKDDSLPAMPTWGGATSRRVEDHSQPEPESHEMSRFDQKTPSATANSTAAVGRRPPVRSPDPAMQRSRPQDDYGYPDEERGQGDGMYMGAAGGRPPVGYRQPSQGRRGPPGQYDNQQGYGRGPGAGGYRGTASPRPQQYNNRPDSFNEGPGRYDPNPTARVRSPYAAQQSVSPLPQSREWNQHSREPSHHSPPISPPLPNQQWQGYQSMQQDNYDNHDYHHAGAAASAPRYNNDSYNDSYNHNQYHEAPVQQPRLPDLNPAPAANYQSRSPVHDTGNRHQDFQFELPASSSQPHEMPGSSVAGNGQYQSYRPYSPYAGQQTGQIHAQSDPNDNEPAPPPALPGALQVGRKA